MKFSLKLATILAAVQLSGALRLQNNRQRRAALSLPSDSSITITTDLIVPVLPLLNTTLTYLWFDFPITYAVPTASDLHNLYSSFSSERENENGDDVGDEKSSNEIDVDFIEEHRANSDRRIVYKYFEGLLQRYRQFTVILI